MSDHNLTDIVLLHDKELAKIKRAVPAFRAKLNAELSSRVENLHADLIIKQAVVGQETAASAKRELLTHAESIRTDLTGAAERALAGLLVKHESKLAELGPHVTQLAKETALEVTREFAQSLPDLPALPSAGSVLVDANKGNWNASTVYGPGDIVFFMGSSYLVLKQTKRGEFPSNQNQNKPTATYQILAATGAPGRPGDSSAGGSSLPDQTGHAGEYLTTDGSTASWAALAGGGDVVASGTLTANALIIGGGGTTVSAATTGTGVLTALGVNVGSAGAFITFNGNAGTPSALVGTNITGTAAGLTAGVASAVAVGGITGLGTGVATALAINVGSAGAPVTFNGAGGTPSSLTLTNATGLPTGGLLDDAVTLAKMAAGTAGNLITYDASGDPAAVATGTAGHVLTSNGAGAAPTFQAAASGGTKTYAAFTPLQNQPPAAAFATLDTRNSIAVLDFDDTTEETAIFVSVIPEAASLGSGLKVRIKWMATSATTGDCRWGVAFMAMNATTDNDSDSFDTAAEATTTTEGVSGETATTEITITTIDSLAAGDAYRLKVYRDTGDAGDTMAGDAEVIAVEVRSAA